MSLLCVLQNILSSRPLDCISMGILLRAANRPRTQFFVPIQWHWSSPTYCLPLKERSTTFFHLDSISIRVVRTMAFKAPLHKENAVSFTRTRLRLHVLPTFSSPTRTFYTSTKPSYSASRFSYPKQRPVRCIISTKPSRIPSTFSTPPSIPLFRPSPWKIICNKTSI